MKRIKVKMIKHRIAAGLFGIILLLTDVTSAGMTVLAQETEYMDQIAAQQEMSETEDGITELPGITEDESQNPDGLPPFDENLDKSGNESIEGENENDVEEEPAEGEDDVEEKTVIGEEFEVNDDNSNAKEQDIHTLAADAKIIAYGSYKECDSDITWFIDTDGKLTIEGTGEFAERYYDMDTPRAPWHKEAARIKTAQIRVSGMTDASGMFRDCINLTDVDFSSFNTEKMTDMSFMFFGCSGLETLDMSMFDTANVKNMESMFEGCSKLATIYTPRHLHLSAPAELPAAKSSDKWYSADGKIWSELPQNDNSILLQKNKAISAGTAEAELTFTYVMTNDNIIIEIPENVIYNGYPKVPAPTVTRKVDGALLVQGKDYTVSYKNNVYAGDEAEITVAGQNDYSGQVSTTFSIKPAKLTIQAEDITLAVGDELPDADEFPYEAIGLSLGDKDQLKVTGYRLTDRQGDSVTNIDTTNTGIYDVTLMVDVGYNYEVESKKGKLTIAEERIAYAVTFDMMGHGDNIEIAGITKAGSLLDIDGLNRQLDIDIPREKDGGTVTDKSGRYSFTGWYKDKTFAAKQKWNFDTDTVQANTILYACWIEIPEEKGGAPLLSLGIQDIQYQYYTGSAIKPAVYVYSADGRTLLKSGKDYTVSYANNTNAVQKDGNGNLPVIGTASVTNPGKKNEEIENVSGNFSKDYPYIIITGKGNYSATIYKNFYILPVDVGDGNEEPAEGFTLKYSEQLVTNVKKDQNPFTSLKYKKAMTLGKDYRITLKAEPDVKCDESVIPEEGVAPSKWLAETEYIEKTKKYTAPVIPKGYYGTFTMTVEGVGNYEGDFKKTVVVTDKNHLMKNASVMLGRNQKSLAYQKGNALTLQPGYTETVTVDKKKQTLHYRVDKSGTMDPVIDTTDIFLVKAGGVYLVYGKDYYVSYTDNNKVGTATMTIMGMGNYLGTKSVTFKITGTAFNTKNVTVKTYDAKQPEETAGCLMPSMIYTGKEITQSNVTLKLTATTADPDPAPLVYGIHYTISYKNNIRKGTATMTFTAKPESGYSGSFKKTFRIAAANLAIPNTIIVKAVNERDVNEEAVNEKEYRIEKQNNENGNVVSYRLIGDVAYAKGGARPSGRIRIELTDESGGAGIPLKEGTDYTVTYKNNTVVTVTTPDLEDNKKPYMIIMGKGNYTGKLTIYFDIGKAEISKNDIIVSQMAWNAKARDTYEYKPGVKVVDSVSSKTLGVGAKKDYIVAYEHNDQLSVSRYIMGEKDAAQPMVVITVPEKSSYKLADGEAKIRVPLPIYKTRLTSSNLYVVIPDAEQTIYTGKQLMPAVVVYYGDTASISKARKDKVADDNTLKNVNDNYKLRKLREKTGSSDETGDYTLAYGANITVGTNKGSVTVTGASKEFGGSVTVKFSIIKKGVTTIVRVTSFTLNAIWIEGKEGTEYQLNGDIQPENATYNTIGWESINDEIASVDSEGRVLLKKEGKTLIKAYTDQGLVAEQCLVIVNNEKESGSNNKYITPQMYMDDAGGDYTKAFNDAINAIEDGLADCDTLFVPAGTYRIDATKSIKMKGNMKLIMSPDAVLKAIGNAQASYDVININYAYDITISGGKIIGERDEHRGTAGEWGMGIGIYRGRNINITGVDISQCWGDGIYLGSVNSDKPGEGCRNVNIADCELHDNRRNNLSIVSAENVTVERCRFNNAHGTAPEFGIDIETNNPDDPCQGIEIKNSTFDGNGQGSMGIITVADNIRIEGCTLNGDFLNYEGTNVVVSNSTINAKVHARIGVTLEEGARINDGRDELVATFSASRCPYPFDAAACPYTIGRYGDDNISLDIIEDNDSLSGKALYLKCDSDGNKEAGYYLDLGELTGDGSKILKKGATYRFEYRVKGSGQWGIRTDQTNWYPCVPMSDKFSTGIMTCQAVSASSCKLYLYAIDKTRDMELEIESINIYKVK